MFKFFKKIAKKINNVDIWDAKSIENSDPKKAIKIYTDLAENANIDAIKSLARIYDHGIGYDFKDNFRNNLEAEKWYLRAFEKGDLISIEYLWQMFIRTPESNKTKKYLLQAAHLNIQNSMRVLGLYYLIGDLNLTQNFELGIEWLTKAAKSGCSWSAFELAKIYNEGIYTNKNSLKAYIWALLASAKEADDNNKKYMFEANLFEKEPDLFKNSPKYTNGGKSQLLRDEIALQISKQDILIAQNIATQCTNGNFTELVNA